MRRECTSSNENESSRANERWPPPPQTGGGPPTNERWAPPQTRGGPPHKAVAEDEETNAIGGGVHKRMFVKARKGPGREALLAVCRTHGAAVRQGFARGLSRMGRRSNAAESRESAASERAAIAGSGVESCRGVW